MSTNLDELYMSRCINLAKLGSTWVAPNPMVGCVIVWENEIIGEGYHEKFGDNHAEINAIKNVRKEDLEKLKSSTIYVSLEPCAHQGKTPPCSNAIIQHGFKKVVIGCVDSNEQVAGKGIQQLKDAGIEVIEGVLKNECIELNKRFFTFQNKKRPYITLKWAQTKNNFIDQQRDTTSSREVFWISHPETQSLVHLWRSEEHAILVGWKTVNNDNPSLNVRKVKGKNPIRIIVDARLQSNLNSIVFNDQEKTLVLNSLKNEITQNINYIQLETMNVRTIIDALYKEGIVSVIIEGGGSTLQHFIDSNLWDEAKIIVGQSTIEKGLPAPKISGIPSSSMNYSNDTIYTYLNR